MKDVATVSELVEPDIVITRYSHSQFCSGSYTELFIVHTLRFTIPLTTAITCRTDHNPVGQVSPPNHPKPPRDSERNTQTTI